MGNQHLIHSVQIKLTHASVVTCFGSHLCILHLNNMARNIGANVCGSLTTLVGVTKCVQRDGLWPQSFHHWSTVSIRSVWLVATSILQPTYLTLPENNAVCRIPNPEIKRTEKAITFWLLHMANILYVSSLFFPTSLGYPWQSSSLFGSIRHCGCINCRFTTFPGWFSEINHTFIFHGQ